MPCVYSLSSIVHSPIFLHGIQDQEILLSTILSHAIHIFFSLINGDAQLDGVDGVVKSWFTGMFFIRGSTVPAFFKVHDLGGELDGVSFCRHVDTACIVSSHSHVTIVSFFGHSSLISRIHEFFFLFSPL